jgi:hypothetical protein
LAASATLPRDLQIKKQALLAKRAFTDQEARRAAALAAREQQHKALAND